MRYLFALLLLFPLAAIAQESTEVEAPHKLEGKQYSPEHCDFAVIFPEEPLQSRRCETDAPDTCFDLISYTKVFDLSASIRVDIICNPSTPEMYEKFSQPVMENTVRAMTKKSVLEAFEINSKQNEHYRLSGLLGKGQKGLEETIYVAQLWVSKNSIMSVEAEMSGESSPEVDRAFAQVLLGIGYKGKEAQESEKEPTASPELTPADQQ
ncbi:MAG: hypothetical protein GC137_04940 [Alphaproteobacteria bacterium]|nr:hypothetical protein [Alphaproteobacteria bacterium]